jgi:acetoin utilization deacetylase AcuC-like enzyme
VVRSTGGKVTVLDVDYHHGNGTQQLFWDRPDVQYVSLHADPARAYPFFTGYADETGGGRGAGTTLNLPLAARTDDAVFADALERALDAIDTFDPSVVIVSLGVDTYELDPIGDLAVTTEGMRASGAQVARRGRPLVVLQEGGYHIGHIGRNVHAWLDGVLNATH